MAANIKCTCDGTYTLNSGIMCTKCIIRDVDILTPIQLNHFFVCGDTDIDLFKFLLNRVDPNEGCLESDGPYDSTFSEYYIIHDVSMHDSEKLKLLLEYPGINLNIKNKDRHTALDYLCYNYRYRYPKKPNFIKSQITLLIESGLLHRDDVENVKKKCKHPELLKILNKYEEYILFEHKEPSE